MKQLQFFAAGKIPLVVAYGMGVDSTAELIELARRGIRPDLILFADTGGEKKETYDFGQLFNDWLKREGFPEIITVRYVPKDFKNWPPYYTLEANCLTNGTLPSLAFGFKSCSLKWKVTPQNKYVERWEPARVAWAAGEKVIKLIGYDAGPADVRRRNHAGDSADPQYAYQYPLIEWDWDRERCKEEIKKAGLPVPPKSSCTFCPAMKPEEVQQLPPEKLRGIVVMEARAKPRLRGTEGLWRKATKTRPGSMTEFICERGLLSRSEVDHLITTVPHAIVTYQQGYAEAKQSGTLHQFLSATPEPLNAIPYAST